MSRLQLRPYQSDAVVFLRSKRKAALHDPPGAGKSLQAAEAALPPVLVACPTYLTDMWADFLERQFPGHTVVNASDGDHAYRQEAIGERAHWTVINTEMLQETVHRDKKGKILSIDSYKFPTKHYQTLILDEAHHLKGRNSSRAKRALALAKTIPYVYELTATPQMTEPDDYYMQLKILDPKRFTSYWQWVEEYCILIDDPWSARVAGVREAAKLRKLVSEYAIARTYEQAGLTLPPLAPYPDVPALVTVPFTREQRQRYDTIRYGYRDGALTMTSAGAMLARLRTATAEMKVEAISRVIGAACRSAVVFCWYHQSAERLANQLPNAVCIHGDMPAKRRYALANRTAPSTTIVATAASLGEGIDLSRYGLVVFAEEDYAPGRNYQALSRVRRYRHTPSEGAEPILCYTVAMERSIDTIVHRISQGREATASALSVAREALHA